MCAQKKIYEKNGEKKIKWYIAGLMKISDTGKRYLLFFHQPNIEYYLFEKGVSLPEIQIESSESGKAK